MAIIEYKGKPLGDTIKAMEKRIYILEDLVFDMANKIKQLSPSQDKPIKIKKQKEKKGK